jgi:hypothetical protein
LGGAHPKVYPPECVKRLYEKWSWGGDPLL